MITTILGAEMSRISRADKDIQLKCIAFSRIGKKTPKKQPDFKNIIRHSPCTDRAPLVAFYRGSTWGIATWLAFREDTLRKFSSVSECGRKLSLAQDTNVVIIKW